MSDGNGDDEIKKTGIKPMRIGTALSAPKKRASLPVIDVPPDSPKLLMNCRACSKGGGEPVDWTINGRRCQAWMEDPQGRCFYEMRAIAVPFDKDEPVTKENWLSDMRLKFNLIGREIGLEFQMNRALGRETSPNLIKAGINLLERMHDVLRHADKMDLFDKALRSGGNIADVVKRLLMALALDEGVRQSVISEIADDDPALTASLNQLVDAMAHRHPIIDDDELSSLRTLNDAVHPQNPA